MSAEQEYYAALRVQDRASRIKTAIPKLSATVSKLQAQDYSSFNRLDPYKRIISGKITLTEFESKARNMRIVEAIKTSLPHLRETVKTTDMHSDYWINLPIWVQMKYERTHGPISSKSLSVIEQTTGLSKGTLSKFEKGILPPRREIVLAYGTVLNLDDTRIRKLIRRTKTERVARKKDALRQQLLRGAERNPDTLGGWISEARRKIGITQLELAKEMGTGREVISDLESGTKSFIYEETIIKLLKVKSFSVPPHLFPEWFHKPSTRGEYLRSLRVQAGISLKDFVSMSGRMRETIVNSEKRLHPAKTTVEIYEKILGIKINFPKFD